jgi:large subunit ribosomal protein L17
MLANMANSLIEHKRINTTVAKAKALKLFVEPLITKSKDDTTHNRRIVFSYLKNKTAVTELFREVAAKVGDRPGGYTRIIKTGTRLGDNAEMCMIELVDFNELYTNAKKEATKSKRRRRGGSSKAKAEATPAAEVVEETKSVEETAEAAPAEEAPAKEEAPKAEAKDAPAEDSSNEEEKKGE